MRLLHPWKDISDGFSGSTTTNGGGLPFCQVQPPKELFAKHLEKEKSHAIQGLEAAKLLTYINSVPASYDNLAHTGLVPFPMLLVKVPGTHNVRFITGLAPLLQDAFQPADPSHGQLYALLQDIDKPDQDAKVLRLPRSALKLMDVMIPTEDQWFDKLVKKDNGQNIKVGSSNRQ